MKKLNLSAVANTNGFPVKSGTFAHIQSAYQEALSSIVQSIIFGSLYDPAKAYILHGCVATGTDPGARTFTAGAIFYNGEIYQVDAASFTTTGSQVAVGVISTTYFSAVNADPVAFTDGVSRNVHEIRKIVIQAGLSGSGDFNFTDAVDMRYKPIGCIGQTINWKLPSGSLTDYFDGTGLGIHQLTDGWAIANGANGTDDFGGNVMVGYKDGDTDFGTIGDTGGTKKHTLSQAELPNYDLSKQLGNETVTGGGTPIPGIGSGTYHTFTINSGGGGQAHNNLQPYKVALFIQRIA